MGMIESTAPTGGKMSPLLAKVEAKVESTVKPNMKAAYNRIIAGGLKFAFDPKAHGTVVQGLDKSVDPVHDVAVGVVGILILMSKKAQGTMPTEAMVPAGLVLVLHGLDYLEQTGRMQITNTEVDDATQTYITNLQPKIGLNEKVMGQAVSGAQKAMQDPALMAKYKESQNGNAQ